MVLKNILLTASLVLVHTFYSSAQGECGAEVTVLKNRKIMTISPENGFTFTFYVENTGSSSNEFSISAIDANETCVNPDGSSNSLNISLSKEILDNNQSPLGGSVMLAPGEKYQFYLQLDTPTGLPINTWNCIEIKAEPVSCPELSGSIILHAFNPNPDNQ